MFFLPSSARVCGPKSGRVGKVAPTVGVTKPIVPPFRYFSIVNNAYLHITLIFVTTLIFGTTAELRQRPSNMNVIQGI